MSHDINRWIFEIPLEDIQEFFDDEEHKIACICCGRKINKLLYQVHLVDGCLVSTEEPFDDSIDSGFYPIHTNCKNKLPNNFYFKEK